MAYCSDGNGCLISTHGPTRGPTAVHSPQVSSPPYFNSRPHTGADIWSGRTTHSQHPFQLTAPHGGRHLFGSLAQDALPFQLTAPHGGRRWHKERMRALGAFQLTAPHGGRPGTKRRDKRRKDFNSRPHTGADLAGKRLLESQGHFNSRPHTGADCLYLRVYHVRDISTHGPTRGPTDLIDIVLSWCLFQLTAPHGGRRIP